MNWELLQCRRSLAPSLVGHCVLDDIQGVKGAIDDLSLRRCIRLTDQELMIMWCQELRPPTNSYILQQRKPGTNA